MGTIDWLGEVNGSTPSLQELIEVIGQRFGSIELVALDIPLSSTPIMERRAADRAVSREYGKKGASTHSPNAKRPGAISETLFHQLTASGYSWVVCDRPWSKPRKAFIETYPHPAIIEMLGLCQRLPYKVSRRSRYSPGLRSEDRWLRIAQALDALRQGLAERIGGVESHIPSANSLLCQSKSKARTLKGIEDALDALVCAWVGWEYANGRTVPYGDAYSAIWLPSPTRVMSCGVDLI
jgi:predicted RNase H-like nuclease